MSSASLFSWLHLSDIHIGHGGASHVADQELVLDALRRDVEAQLKDAEVPRPDAILVTGDIAFSGATVAPDEYTRAAKHLKAIARAANVPDDAIYVVPGNHDVQRAVDKPARAKDFLTKLRANAVALDTCLANAASIRTFAKRQAKYLKFAEEFAPACRAEPSSKAPRLVWKHITERSNGLRVRLCGLNTALLAADENVFGSDQKQLCLGKRQLNIALLDPPIEADEVVIVLSHHPFVGDWLRDQYDAHAWTASRAHIHLSGHVHEAGSVWVRSGGGGAFVHVAAGAVHGEAIQEGQYAQHGYSFGALVEVDGAIELHLRPRRWSPPNAEFRLDPHTTIGKTGVAIHPLRRGAVRRSAAVGTSTAGTSNETGRTPPPPPVSVRPVAPHVERVEAEVRVLLGSAPRVVEALRQIDFGTDAASIARALVRERTAGDVVAAVDHALDTIEADPEGLDSDRRAARALFELCVRYSVNWLNLVERGRAALTGQSRGGAGCNAIELEIWKAPIAEIVLAGVDDRVPAFGLSEKEPLFGLTHVKLPPVIKAPFVMTQQRFVEVMVEHLAGTVFKDNADLDAAKSRPGSAEAIAEVEGVLRSRGYRRFGRDARPYYVTFDSDHDAVWRIARDAQALPTGLPSLRLVRLTGVADATEQELIETIKRILTRSRTT